MLDTFMGKAEVAFSNLARDCTLQSHEGDIAIRLPASTGFDLDVDLEAAAAIFAYEAPPRTPSREGNVSPVQVIRRQSYRGTINGGGAKLNLVTHSGSLRLSSTSDTSQ